MIRTDRKIKNAITKLKPSMSDYMLYVPSEKEIQIYNPADLHNIIKSIPIKINPDIAKSSIQRLISAGYLEVSLRVHDGFFFSVTSRFILRYEFWWNDFSQRFISGLLSGIIGTVLVELLVAFLRAILGI